MNYKIAIPSYKRPEQIKKWTLAYLDKCGIDPSSVYIFLSNADELQEYQESLGDVYNLVYETDLHNLKEKHNFIVDYFDEGEHIVLFEDDIQHLVKKKTNRSQPFYDLDQFIGLGFIQLYKTNCKIFGVTPTANGFYMANKYGKCFKVIAGYFFGFINDKRIKVNISSKHDYERTILHHINFGGVVRFDMLGQASSSFTNPGGLQSQYDSEARKIEELETNRYLLTTYPTYVAKRNRPNKILGGVTELRLLRQ